MKKALGEANREHVDIIRKFKKEFKVEAKIENGAEDFDGEI
jgi:hypothetical protein